ncbi:MAG TPA: nucleotidyltransferase domain-containing protein [Tepidisphaeraceae bacterium]|nr:nucleotidyltransferase domain-containing protein [Tepidisphaeraceae bacterium]
MVAPNDPGAVLFGRTRQAVLSLLFTRPDESFYLREIVRRTGGGTGAVQRELAQLVACGILRKEKDRFFQANPQSSLFEPLKQLVVRTVGLADRLRDALIEARDQIAVAFIFGSFVRGEQRRESDIDVMVIATDPKLTLERVSSLLRPQEAPLGREINPFVLPLRELRQKWESGNHFVRRVLGGDKILLMGSENELKRVAEARLAKSAPGKSARSHGPARSGRA